MVTIPSDCVFSRAVGTLTRSPGPFTVCACRALFLWHPSDVFSGYGAKS